MCQFQNRTLLIQMFLLILPHAEDLLVIESLKPGCQCIIRRALNRLQFPAVDAQRHTVTVDPVSVAPIFLRQQFPFLIVEADPALVRYFCRNFTICEGRLYTLLMILHIFLRLIPRVGHIDLFKCDLHICLLHRLRQSPVILIHSRLFRHPYPQGIDTPWLNDNTGCPVQDKQFVSVLL